MYLQKTKVLKLLSSKSMFDRFCVMNDLLRFKGMSFFASVFQTYTTEERKLGKAKVVYYFQ